MNPCPGVSTPVADEPVSPLRRFAAWDWPFLVACAMGVVFGATYAWLSVERHVDFQSHAFDLGNYSQAMWNTIHGAPFRFTNQATISDPITSRLAIHVEPILLLLAPLYLIHAGPSTLLITQAVVVGAGTIPAYLLARTALGNRWAALVFPLAYVLDPALQAATLDDFHAVTLCAPLLLFALYFGLFGDLRLFVLTCVLAAATKEEIGLIVALIAVIVIVKRGAPAHRAGCWIAVGGILWSLVAIGLIIPHFNPLGHSPYLGRYRELGHGLFGVLEGIVRDPIGVWGILTRTSRVHFLTTLLGPLAYLSLLAPWVALTALPDLLIDMLSTKPGMYSGFYQYPASIVPIFIAAAAIGVGHLLALARAVDRRLLARKRRRMHMTSESRMPANVPWRLPPIVLAVALTGLVACAFVQQYREGFSPLARGFSEWTPGPHQQLESRLLASVPAGAPLSASDEINPHVADRSTLYLFPTTHAPGLPAARYAVLDASIPSRPIEPHTLRAATSSLMRHGWGVIAARDGILTMARDHGAHALPSAFFSFAYPHHPHLARRTRRHFGPLVLLGYTLHPSLGRATWARPAVSVDTYWRLERPPRSSTSAIHIAVLCSPVFRSRMPRVGPSWSMESDSPTLAWLPVSRWRPHRTVLVQPVDHTVDASHAGRVAIDLAVYHGNSPFSGRLGPLLRLGTIGVETALGDG